MNYMELMYTYMYTFSLYLYTVICMMDPLYITFISMLLMTVSL